MTQIRGHFQPFILWLSLSISFHPQSLVIVLDRCNEGPHLITECNWTMKLNSLVLSLFGTATYLDKGWQSYQIMHGTVVMELTLGGTELMPSILWKPFLIYLKKIRAYCYSKVPSICWALVPPMHTEKLRKDNFFVIFMCYEMDHWTNKFKYWLKVEILLDYFDLHKKEDISLSFPAPPPKLGCSKQLGLHFVHFDNNYCFCI